MVVELLDFAALSEAEGIVIVRCEQIQIVFQRVQIADQLSGHRKGEKDLKKVNESGIRIFYLGNKMRWNQPGDENTPDGTAQTLADIKFLLDAAPNAYIMLRLVVNPSADWINAHPDEQVRFNDGSREPVICSSAGDKPLDGMISFASESWKREGKAALLEYLEDLEASPLFERVIGVFLSAGGTGEWYYPGENRMHNEKKGTYADFSEPFRTGRRGGAAGEAGFSSHPQSNLHQRGR